MFEHYLDTDSEGRDGEEYGRCAALLDDMARALTELGTTAATDGSAIADLDDAFSDAPITALPSVLLRNALDHAVLNLKYAADAVTQAGMGLSVPALMACIRIALLSASHASYVVTETDASGAVERMGSIYKLEVKSAAKYIDQIDVHNARDHCLPQIVPASGSPIRQLARYRNPHPPKVRVSESVLLDAMKQNVFANVLRRMGYGPALSGILTDQLFNTTSGAAHGYAWIDLGGVTAHFVPQLSFATTVTNVVFNDYLCAAGHRDSWR
ncbi:MAG: hypothetical protein QM658_16145 [Gordonia sp. (in: high G+C Gram-positive bacteria)]